MDLRPLTLDNGAAWAELLGAAFDRPASEVLRSLEGLHQAYPVVAWGMWDGDALAAQYSCLMKDLAVPGHDRPMPVGFSVNMAVHPTYRGRGLIKRVAEPVYEAVRGAGGVAGVGFSNRDGVKVDKRSKTYGYQVVGRLRSTVAFLARRPRGAERMTLTDQWPAATPSSSPPDGLVRFANTAETLSHRYAGTAPGRYRFAVDSNGGDSGAVAYRTSRRGGLRVASLLGAHGDDTYGLLAPWAQAMWDDGVRLIHTLASPNSVVTAGLRRVAITGAVPVSRSPYYLTVRPLLPETPAILLDFSRWDCTGGDVL